MRRTVRVTLERVITVEVLVAADVDHDGPFTEVDGAWNCDTGAYLELTPSEEKEALEVAAREMPDEGPDLMDCVGGES